MTRTRVLASAVRFAMGNFYIVEPWWDRLLPRGF